jgi:hypothetical protein
MLVIVATLDLFVCKREPLTGDSKEGIAGIPRAVFVALERRESPRSMALFAGLAHPFQMLCNKKFNVRSMLALGTLAIVSHHVRLRNPRDSL